MYSDEVIEKLARILAYYTEDGTMCLEASKFEFPPAYLKGKEIPEGTKEAFIADTKQLFTIAEILSK